MHYFILVFFLTAFLAGLIHVFIRRWLDEDD